VRRVSAFFRLNFVGVRGGFCSSGAVLSDDDVQWAIMLGGEMLVYADCFGGQ
jgi:hypothetical protein